MKMTDKLRKRILATKGVEFTFLFDKENGEDLDGLSSPAYVAQADPDIGITIMGSLPEGVDPKGYGVKDGSDIVLQCCSCYDNPDHQDYVRIVEEYVEMIESGGIKQFSNETIDGDHSDGGNAVYMMDSCPFNQ